MTICLLLDQLAIPPIRGTVSSERCDVNMQPVEGLSCDSVTSCCETLLAGIEPKLKVSGAVGDVNWSGGHGYVNGIAEKLSSR